MWRDSIAVELPNTRLQTDRASQLSLLQRGG